MIIFQPLKRPDSRTLSLSFTPKHTNLKPIDGDMCISLAAKNPSAVENSHQRPLTRLSHCLALRLVVKHSPSPSIFTHKHLAVLLSFITPIYSLSNHINPLEILLSPHFHITPNQIHKTLSFIPVEIESCRLKISGISQRKLSLKDSVLLCRTRVFKTRDLNK